MRAALMSLITLLAPTFAATVHADKNAQGDEKHHSVFDFTVENIEGEKVDLGSYKGKTVLIVNVASRCGLTGQYAGLQKLYEKHKDEGFVILGFPCNQFNQQEPGSNAQILEFCTSRYDVSFPMFSKIEVNGENASPLYKYLTRQDAPPVGPGDISWNFEKFLINGEGKVVRRFAPPTAPDDKALVAAVEAELEK